MFRQPKLETLLLLDCLVDAARDAAELLLHPTVGRFTSGCSWEDESLERKLRRLAARGVITLPKPTDPRIVRLTEHGRTLALGGVDPEARCARPWDKQWRMVLFDVTENNRRDRDRLRGKLSRTRLGYLQGSVWVTPDPLAELRAVVRSTAADPEALLFFEGHASAGESDGAIVDGAWDFARINELYREAMNLHAAIPRAAEPPHRWHQWLAEERHAWLDALARDPLLPESLLPAEYLGREAYHSHRRALRQVARHIFAYHD